MKINIIQVIFLLSLFFISCEEVPPLSAEEQMYLDRAKLVIIMDDETFEATISVKKFDKVSFMKFSIIYNYDKYDIISYKQPDASLQWSNLDDPNLDHNTIEFIFSGTIKNEQDLVTLQFQKPSNYEGTRIVFKHDILIKDDNGETIYSICTNPEYTDPLVCSVSGGAWSWDGTQFSPQGTCYISQHPSSDNDDDGELDYLFPPDNDFRWTNQYCDVSQDGGP